MRMARGGRWLWVAPLFGLVVSVVIAAVGQDETAMAAGILLGQVGALVLGLLWLLLDVSESGDHAEGGRLASLSEHGAPSQTPAAAELSAPPDPPAIDQQAPVAPVAALVLDELDLLLAAVDHEPRAGGGTPPGVVEAMGEVDGVDLEPDAQVRASSAREVGVAVTPRRLLWLVTVLVVVQVFLQYPGQLVHDTRLDLALEPVDFVSRLWDLWEPLADMGRLRNQSIGYLFPMGPFFILGSLLAIPEWMLIRLWIAVVLIVALWGFARLADLMEIGSPVGRLLASVAYIASPLFVARVGNTSWFVLGAALVPWSLIPLIRASQGGQIRRRAAASGVAVLLAGGINAAITVGMLGIPALFILTREGGPRRRRLLAWWSAAVVAATLWWLVPLALQSRYGYNFLPVTERAYTTTAFASPFEVLRGLGDWLSYARFVRTPLPSGWDLATDGWAIFGSATLAAIGAFGLARRDLPHRRFLVLTFLCGAALLGAGYGGVIGSPIAGLFERLLDGPLGPIRSVFKFQPMILLPLTLGFAHGITILLSWLSARRWSWARPVGMVVAVLVLVAAASPVMRGDLLNDDAIDAVPSWWTETAEVVSDAPGRVLVVPGLAQADFTWGYPAEEPMQWLATVPWATRNIVPLGGTDATVVLDTIENALSRGGDVGLDAYLAQNGFSTVVVRNDGKWRRYGAPSPESINLAVRASGLVPEASIGPKLLSPADPLTPDIALRQIEVYSVPAFTADGLATTFPKETAAVVSGDSGAALRLQEFGLADRALILARDADPADLPSEWIITDTNRRRYTSFGLNRANGSYVLTPTEGGPNGLPLERGLLPATDISGETTMARRGVTEITASSYGSFLVPIPEAAPGRAIDGDSRTAWVSSAQLEGEGAWIELELEQPVDVDSLEVELLDDGPWRTRVEAIEVVTDSGSVETRTKAGEGPQVLVVPPGPTERIRLVFSDVQARPGGRGSPGIREIRVPGVEIDQRLAAPAEFSTEVGVGEGPLPTYVLDRSRVSAFSILRRDEERSLRRQITVPRSGELALAATVVPRASPALLGLLDDSEELQVSASSTLADLPRFAPRNLVDGDPDTLWIGSQPPDTDVLAADPDVVAGEVSTPWQEIDEAPTVSMSWSGLREISELRIESVSAYSRPVSVQIDSDGERRDAEFDPDGVARFDPLLTDSIEIRFPRTARYVVGDGVFGPQVRPIALSALVPGGLDDLLPGPIDEAPPIVVTCEDGPVVRIGDEERRLSLEVSASQLVAMQPVEAALCDDSPVLVTAGQTAVDAVDVGAFSVASLVLRDPSRPGGASGLTGAGPDVPSRAVEIEDWGNVDRRISIAAGPEAYLAIQENINPGWKATLDGEDLQPVTLFGWQQGFIIPTGSGGLIDLHFAPSGTYRGGLAIGAFLVLLLVLAALPLGRSSSSPSLGEGRWSLWFEGVLMTGAAVMIGGIAAPIAWLLWWLRNRRWRLIAALGGLAFFAAGLLVAITQTPRRQEYLGAYGLLATGLALIAIFRDRGEPPIGPTRAWRLRHRPSARRLRSTTGVGADETYRPWPAGVAYPGLPMRPRHATWNGCSGRLGECTAGSSILMGSGCGWL